ncbi:MAG: hypothetical protein KDA87_02790 [Planctomycetales bacterium]|nr:hypothetical protein [Planctomycetales bacterium]
MNGSYWETAESVVRTGWALAESKFRHRYGRQIPIRIYIAGTPGSSGLTRLVAAGLRAGGVRTLAQTSNSSGNVLLPDGSEQTSVRTDRSSLVHLQRAAVQANAEAIVVQGHQDNPFVSCCEQHHLDATHGVYLAATGEEDESNRCLTLQAFAKRFAPSATLFVSDQNNPSAPVLNAGRRHANVVSIMDDDIAAVTWDELDGFPYVETPDTVATALRVCQRLGVDRQTALGGMWSASPDPGVMTVFHRREKNGQISLINCFASNGLESTPSLWRTVTNRFRHCEKRIAVVNCQSNQPGHMQQLVQWSVGWQSADQFLVTGAHADSFRQFAMNSGLQDRRIRCLENSNLSAVLQSIDRVADNKTLVVGVGSFSGLGLQLVRYFRQLETTSSNIAYVPKRRTGVISKAA